MALYLDHFVHVQQERSAPVSLRTRIRFEGGSFADISLDRAIALARTDLFKTGVDKTYALRVLSTPDGDE